MPGGRNKELNISRQQQESILGRLRLFMLTMFSVGGFATLTAAWLFSYEAANEAYDRLLISAAVQFVDAIASDQSGVVISPPDAAFETLALASNDRIFYSVWDPTGVLITGYPELKADSALTSEQPVIGNTDILQASVRTASVARFISASNQSGWFKVVVAQTRSARLAMASELMAKTGALVLFITLLGYLGSMVAAKACSSPALTH